MEKVWSRWLACVCMVFLGVLVAGPSASAAVGIRVREFNRGVVEMVSDPSRPRIYATTRANTLLVINTETLQIEKEILVGATPHGLDISPDGSLLYVANSRSTTAGIAVVDLETLTILRTLSTTSLVFDVAAGLGGRLYLLSGSEITQVDGVTGTLQATLSEYHPAAGGHISIYGGMLSISADRKTLYYGNEGLSPAGLARYDVSGTTPILSQVTPHASIGSNGQDLILNADGSALCYAVGSGNAGYDIALIPGNNINARIGSFFTDAYPCNGAFSPDGTTFYTAPSSQYVVQIFNTTTFLKKGAFLVSGRIRRLLCESSGRYLFAANEDYFSPETETLSVFSLFEPVIPVITSATAVDAHQDEAFSFALTADHAAVTWSANGLPAGLTLDAQTGVISGVPSTAGKFTVNIVASGRDGNRNGRLSITVLTPLTVVVNGSGTVTEGFEGTTWQEVGKTVQLQATPAVNHLFTHWSGSSSSTSSMLSFKVQPNMSLQANFVPSTTLSIKINGPGLIIPVSPGTLVLPVGGSFTVTAQPQHGARFLGWTGTLQSQQARFTFAALDEPMTLTANFELMRPYAGSYQLLGVPASPEEERSTMQVKLGTSGWFTASLMLGRQRFSFGGNLLSPNGFDLELPRKGGKPPVLVHLEIENIDGNPTITGIVDAGDGPHQVAGYRLKSFSKAAPAQENGKYNFLLPSAGADDLPLAWGYGSAQVSKLGAVVFKGVLGDGTSFSASGALTEDGYVRIQRKLYGNKGFLNGWVKFSEQAQSDLTGELSWMRPARPRDKVFPDGFAILQALTGSRIAGIGEEFLPFASGKVSISGGGLAVDSDTDVTIEPGNRVVALAPDTNLLRVSVKPKTGVFSGSFLPQGTQTKARRTFRGVIDMKSQIAVGQFTGTAGRGSVVLHEGSPAGEEKTFLTAAK